jgi:indolepyruvate ferredoxin oxidoreductase beta subunit
MDDAAGMSLRPIKLLIGALGGEGGGVLSTWIVSAATAEGLPVQSTSIPGVAQRTGATTYYIEISPKPGRAPLFALTPSAGDLDLLAASELMEAARAIGNGFASAERTTLVASVHRVFAMTEKMAGGDGSYDVTKLLHAIEQNTQRAVLFDADAAAREAKSAINAVLLGAIAGTGVLPIAAEKFEAAIRAEEKSVEANLRGFRTGLAYARGDVRWAPVRPGKRPHRDVADADALIERARQELPAAAAEFAAEGVKRLTAYQDAAYAALYLDRLGRVASVERSLAGNGQIARETARQLAVRMSFEDVIRVAQLKSDRERFERIRRDLAAGDDQPVVVIDYFKPGVEELCSVLPPRLARRIIDLAERHGWKDLAYLGMEVRSSSILGFLRLRLLAKLRWWRPRAWRWQQEQQAIEAWLERVVGAARISLPLAAEIVDCARLVRGYGETHRRGRANYELIAAELIDPALRGDFSPSFAADAIASARAAALKDPEGESLTKTLDEIRTRQMAKVA